MFDVPLSATRPASDVLEALLDCLRPYQKEVSVLVACATTWALLRWLRTSRQRVRTTELCGPPKQNFLYGVTKQVLDADDSGAVYEAWAKEYGGVYTIPAPLGSKRVVLCDPKAIAHFHSKESWTYVQIKWTKVRQNIVFGKGLLSVHGEDHRRQRKSLSPGFAIPAIRKFTPIFCDSGYKLKAAWDAIIESNGGDESLIEVQNWMNCVSLDNIGNAGFSHDFGALNGKRSSIKDVLDTFSQSPRKSALSNGFLLMCQFFPLLTRLPTPRTKLLQKLGSSAEEIAHRLYIRDQKEKEMGITDGKEDRSIIKLFIEAADRISSFHPTKEEVIAQMKVLLVAGYETTSISLTWLLIELSRNPDVQTKLREELLQHGSDPTYDELVNGLPYLDAVVHESLRVHPVNPEFTRVAIEDDVIPLSEPVLTKSGELVDKLTIAKGTLVTYSIQSTNRSAAIWGADAKIFRPSRWLEDAHGHDDIPAKAKEVHGYRHMLTFSDGPKVCLGRHFAVVEIKAVLSVLLKHFVFEMRDGVDAKIETELAMLLRPKVAGEEGCLVPLCVRPYVA